jgi:hypothetical protein
VFRGLLFWLVTEKTVLPMATSNNAVCEGFIDSTSFVYSFGGIDITGKNIVVGELLDNKISLMGLSGIHIDQKTTK